jgi:diguanylate cyclase (GGDEF)-like protein
MERRAAMRRGLEPGRKVAARVGLGRLRRSANARRTMSLQLALAMAMVCLVAFLPLAFFGYKAVQSIDDLASVRERTLIERAIKDRIETVSREQLSVTNWDDAVLRSAARDQAWIDENIGLWMHEFYGHDMAIVLDENNLPVNTMIGGENVRPRAFEAASQALAPLILDVRARIAASGEASDETLVTGLIELAGTPSLVSIRPIIPSTDRLAFDPAKSYLHVAVRHLDARFFTEIGERYMIRGLHLDAPGRDHAEEGFALRGVDEALGTVAWSHEMPGFDLVAMLAPTVALSIVALLGAASWAFLRLRRAVARLQDSEERATRLAMHDALTGLPNRALFDLRLDEALAEMQRDDGRVALHCIDLDRFKNVNDTLGHPAGDELLRQVAARLNKVVRSQDTVARLGGDEFAIIQRGIPDELDAQRIAQRILLAIREPFDLGLDMAFVDSSVGTILAPDFGIDRSELMRKADIALYEAKALGKGRQVVFEADQDEVIARKRLIERNLRDDLERGEGLSVVYQPIMAIDGRTMDGAEALARWTHPSHGSVPPAVFIAVAEEHGLIQRLGAWVLREACVLARDLRLRWIAVNVSAAQFRDPHFVDVVLDTLKEVGLSPERLQLEITEGLLLDAAEAVASNLMKLRFAGVCIALDDFGAGYSALNYLHRHRVDKIKIDPSFVHCLGEAESTDAIVRAMIELGRALDLGVTAEGVETEAQRLRLAEFGSPNLQGYLFSHPVSGDALRAFAERATEPRSGAA